MGMLIMPVHVRTHICYTVHCIVNHLGNIVRNIITILLFFLAKAGAPSIPVVDDVDKNSVDLSWQKPLNDGGSPIKGKYSY